MDTELIKNNGKTSKNGEECYREIFFNDHTVMILIDPIKLNIVDANLAAIDFYGYSLEEFSKMKISDINMLDEELVKEEMQKAISKQKNHFIFKHRLSNGKVRDVEVYSGLISHNNKNLLYSIIHDITAHREVGLALLESEKRFRLIFDQLPIGSIIVSLDHTPIRVNNALSIMLGYSKEELLSMKYQEYTHPDDLNMEIEMKILLNSGEIDSFEMEKRYIHKNGNVVWGKLYLSSVKDQTGTPVNIMSMVEDITKRKKLEIKEENLINKLESSNKELEQFAYVSSHDLKEPLRMITSFLQLLQRRYANDLDEDANDFIDFAVEGAQRLNSMINDLLEYSRIGSKEIKFEYLQSEKILETVQINLKPFVEDTNARITHDPLPLIFANDQMMVQLFQNLIGNGIKYRGKADPEVHISAEYLDDEYIFSVKDNGIGIDPKHLERIFTIFQRLNSREEYDGTGIGLAIAQRILQKHNGRIWVESELGKGSTFYFTIPNLNY
jgi:chemotaxis family two-component system sensor kinase Cph1